MHDDSIAMVTTSAIAAWSGVALIAVARRLQFPAIVALLVGGVALGPTGLGVVQPDSLGSALRVVVALAIGLVLFCMTFLMNILGSWVTSRFREKYE